MTDPPATLLSFAIAPVETSRDARGWVSNLLDHLPLPAAGLRNIHIVQLRPGLIRGNHRHHRQNEWIVLCGGPCRVVVVWEGRRREETIVGDVPVMLTLPAGTPHAIRYEGIGEAFLVSFTDQEYSFEHPDVERVELLV
ncbi:MAG: hypothetical protein GX444_14195 [Myxococcales bacterium]|nr:hypothetical protein [Myxococcales bacterium]